MKLCDQCMKATPFECKAPGCALPVCAKHSVPSMQAGDRADGALCLEHKDQQEKRPLSALPTVWLKPPHASLGEPIEIEYTPENATKWMVQGWTQCPAPE